MADLVTRISDVVVRIASESKALRTLINANASDLSALTTTTKTNLVAALNELNSAISTLQSAGYVTIDDATNNSTSKTWSLNKIQSHVSESINAVLSGAPTALDTLNELAAAIGNDSNFAATITTALGNRVRVDAAQTFTDPQKLQARSNIGAQASSEVGVCDTNFVTMFTTGLV